MSRSKKEKRASTIELSAANPNNDKSCNLNYNKHT